MALSESVINKLKVLLYENQDTEATRVLQKESNLSYDEANEYVQRLKTSLSRKPTRSNSKLLLVVFAGLGAVFWVLAIVFYMSKSEQIDQSVIVEGTVTEMVQNEDGSAPVVTYVYDEKEYQYWSSIYSSPPSYSEGDIIELYVTPDNPQEAMINSFVERWLVIMIFGILAIVFDLVAVIAFFARNTSSSSNTVFGDDDDGFSRNFD